MKIKYYLLRKLNAMQEAKWIRPALMTLALVATVFGLTACPHH